MVTFIFDEIVLLENTIFEGLVCFSPIRCLPSNIESEADLISIWSNVVDSVRLNFFHLLKQVISGFVFFSDPITTRICAYKMLKKT